MSAAEDLAPTASAPWTLAGAPEGQDARLLAAIAAEAPQGLLHICLDDARASRLADAIRFFAPELRILSLPAWDCLPYDRVSPNGEIVSQRIETLSRLAREGMGAGCILLTTVNAASQRVPPRARLEETAFQAGLGERLDRDVLTAFLADNGYVRSDTVREPGEFALRGDIVDLYPAGAEEGLRIDLFGDEIERIRSFDPATQRSTGTVEALSLTPVSEVFLDASSIQRFRAGYREAFGAVLNEDPLYEAVSEGRRYAGMEHWLPLFHSTMESVFDYAQGARIGLDHQAAEAWARRQEQIADFFEARDSLRKVAKKAGGDYKPLAPERLYLTASEWSNMIGGDCFALSPFAAAEGDRRAQDGGGRAGRDFAPERQAADGQLYPAIRDHIVGLREGNRRVLIGAFGRGARERLIGLLREGGIGGLAPVADWTEAQALDRHQTGVAVLGLERGFTAPDVALLTEQDILGDRLIRTAKRRKRSSDAFLVEASTLEPGDLVVHAEHGIGRFEKLETIPAGGADHDCIKLVYDGDDRLFVPVENIEMLSRFGSEETEVPLDKLGGAAWQARKARVKKQLMEMADELLRIAATRQVKQADVLHKPEGAWEEFVARFPYAETDDQLRAIEDVIGDLQKGQPMDRLVCGDVGFGKTEVALRAAFLAAMEGHQVAVVVPTTLLARQHFTQFQERFQGLPLRIGQLSRMVTAKEASRVKQGLADGTIDIVIGTHALLSSNVAFKRLGLVIVDEEQRFGVKQKERLKALKADVHVLTLTATPIPRTLQMALTGVRDLSIIATPPVDRLAVRSFVLPYDPVIIREAILREHFRGGQCFYVCPRIADIPELEEQLASLVPEIKVIAAHGRMTPTELEDRMAAFYEGRYDLLLATNIIESGLDIPRANTMIVHRADLFGLAQLYQIRGRIGRSKLRGYAYLTTEPGQMLNDQAKKRLQVIETLDSLGAGFQLASHDLDIRGAGNLLGEAQSGHIREVGVELFQQMLEEAVEAARCGDLPDAAPVESGWSPQIALGVPVLIPEDYVRDLSVRMSLYRRIGTLKDEGELEGFAAELIDRFGPIPEETENLFETVRLKLLCKAGGVERLDLGPKGAVIGFRAGAFDNVAGLVDWIGKQAGSAKLRPDQKLVVMRAWGDPTARLRGAKTVLADLVAVAKAA